MEKLADVVIKEKSEYESAYDIMIGDVIDKNNPNRQSFYYDQFRKEWSVYMSARLLDALSKNQMC